LFNQDLDLRFQKGYQDKTGLMDIGVFQKDKKKLTDIGFFGWFFSGLLDQNCFS